MVNSKLDATTEAVERSMKDGSAFSESTSQHFQLWVLHNLGDKDLPNLVSKIDSLE